MTNGMHEPPYAPAKGNRSIQPLTLSIIGATISILVPVIIFMSSKHSGWGSLTNLVVLGLCGVVSIALGIAALITNNKNRSARIVTIILSAVSIAFGAVVLGLAIVTFILFAMLAGSMR